jgi:hypothetical protein
MMDAITYFLIWRKRGILYFLISICAGKGIFFFDVMQLFSLVVVAVARLIKCESQCSELSRILVIYSYYETPRALRNLEFFLEKTSADYLPGDGSRKRMQYIFVINGELCGANLPKASNVIIVRAHNSGSDMGGYAEGLEAAGIQPNAQIWKSIFSYFFFINSSCRGPFLPPYLDSAMHWTTPFTRMISTKVKIVSPSIQFIPGHEGSWFFYPIKIENIFKIAVIGRWDEVTEICIAAAPYSWLKRIMFAVHSSMHRPWSMPLISGDNLEVQKCDRSMRIWANIPATGAGPRAEGYMFATDAIGLDLWVQDGGPPLQAKRAREG